MPYVLKFGMSKPKETKDEKNHHVFLSKTLSQSSPQPDYKHFVVNAIRNVPLSPLAQNGVVDPRGLSEEARKWLRTSESTNEADSGFFSTKAPTKTQRLFNDVSISDSWFAADAPIPMTKLSNSQLQ